MVFTDKVIGTHRAFTDGVVGERSRSGSARSLGASGAPAPLDRCSRAGPRMHVRLLTLADPRSSRDATRHVRMFADPGVWPCRARHCTTGRDCARNPVQRSLPMAPSVRAARWGFVDSQRALPKVDGPFDVRLAPGMTVNPHYRSFRYDPTRSS